MNFNDYYWTDTIIKEISINRNNPGILDEIIFDIVLTNQKRKSKLIFEDVYNLEMSLNFGIIAEDTILDAIVLEENNNFLIQFYKKWNGHLDNVKLNVYIINLNSTGGKIKIISKGFRVD